jgi:hypothetical protein
MSALAKPLTTTANAIGDVDPINVELIQSVNTLDILADNTQNGKNQFSIIFQMSDADNQPKEVTWRYATANLRDTDFAQFNTNNTVAL